MTWKVEMTGKARKALAKLPERVRKSLFLLLLDIEAGGPVRGDWPNYSKLGVRRHHCHLQKGKPTYVAVWEEAGSGLRLIEVTYVGTHEKAPY